LESEGDCSTEALLRGFVGTRRSLDAASLSGLLDIVIISFRHVSFRYSQ
jgi:hypothetical protein